MTEASPAHSSQTPGLCDLTVVTSSPFAWMTSEGTRSSGQLLFRRYTPKSGAAEFGIFVLREGDSQAKTAWSSLRGVLKSWNLEIEKHKGCAPALYLEDERSPSGYFVAFQDQSGDIIWREERSGMVAHLKEQFPKILADKKCH